VVFNNILLDESLSGVLTLWLINCFFIDISLWNETSVAWDMTRGLWSSNTIILRGKTLTWVH
jgi:hypothetical protein